MLISSSSNLDVTMSYVPASSSPFSSSPRRSCRLAFVTRSALAASASNNDNGGGEEQRKPPLRSRLEGNSRAPTEQELVIMDEMITKLADAKPYELPNAVRNGKPIISYICVGINL